MDTRWYLWPVATSGGTRLSCRSAIVLGVVLGCATFPQRAAGYVSGDGRGNPSNDCLVGLVGFDQDDVSAYGRKAQPAIQCTDCDPSCDTDGLGEPDGVCVVRLAARLNDATLPALCPPATLAKFKAKARTRGTKLDFSDSLTVPPDASSVTGSFVALSVRIRKFGTPKQRPGKGKVRLWAIGSVRPRRRDQDAFLVICNARPTGEPCHATTTSTTTSITTTTSPSPSMTTTTIVTTTSSSPPTTMVTTTTSSSTTVTTVPPGACDGTWSGTATFGTGLTFEVSGTGVTGTAFGTPGGDVGLTGTLSSDGTIQLSNGSASATGMLDCCAHEGDGMWAITGIGDGVWSVLQTCSGACVCDVPGTGCADGEREGFAGIEFADIAGCSGGWDRPGIATPQRTGCGAAGDDGGNPTGIGCGAADLCGIGWHVCAMPAEVGALAGPLGCQSLVSEAGGSVFFAQRQAGEGNGRCEPTGANDIFGCGTTGASLDATCAPLNRSSGDLCSAIQELGWLCGSDGVDEANNAIKTSPDGGGVLCCRNGIPWNACTPATSCPAGQNCGTASDGCGGTIDCGTCPTGETCWGDVCTEGAVAAPSGYDGLQGYISYDTYPPPAGFDMGMGFYAAAWPLARAPLANFQIGLPGTWVLPNNRDNPDTPLCPIGTVARTWSDRAPTWDSVFQTLEGGLGYWAGNRFRYGPPKFSMNSTPQCYDYEVASPGWGFFHGSAPLTDDRLGVAQLSNRLLIPPDGLPFVGQPNGSFLGYSWMALPFTAAKSGQLPTGDQSWTCFLSAANFKGPIAYYVPETWSKIAAVFDYPFDYGRGLDARPGVMGGGAMEINTVPYFAGTDGNGVVYTKIPRLQFPVDDQGRAVLVRDVTYYSRDALYDAIASWRDGGAPSSGQFAEAGRWQAPLVSYQPGFRQSGITLQGIDQILTTQIYDTFAWGIQWSSGDPSGTFPQYFKQSGGTRVPVSAAEVPEETGLRNKLFPLAGPGEAYAAELVGAWASPGPASSAQETILADGSKVTYRWYRFVDQPVFQQYVWTMEEKSRLQALVEEIHTRWGIDGEYMPPLSEGSLVTLDPALIVSPPPEFAVGYVPIVTRQEAAAPTQ